MIPYYTLECTRCQNETVSENETNVKCLSCGGPLEYKFNKDYLKSIQFKGSFTFWRYSPIMPKVIKKITLGEGGTPLNEAKRLGETLGLKKLSLKDETRNPTSSFKDRSASLIVSDAVGKGFDSLICATNGNHGASLAAYSAKVNISCHLVVPNGLDLGKLAQMMVYDAEVTEAGENIEKAIERVLNITKEKNWYQATTELNPLSIEALKTISYELWEQGNVPNWMIVAMGSGVTLYSIWKGFKELFELGRINDIPKLIGVQASGCSPITEAYKFGKEETNIFEKAMTLANAIRVSNPRYGTAALKVIRESGGFSITVTDDEMLEYEKKIARLEGIFAEPASASTVACIPSLIDKGIIETSEDVICLITSSGLKTQDILQSLSQRRKAPILSSKLGTKEHILRKISNQKTYGYALWKSIGKSMTLGAVYQHLSDLEEKGLIKSQLEGKRRYLEITEKGLRVLAALNELKKLV